MRIAAAALVALGLLQMAGDLLRWDALRDLAAATLASPAPKVFSAVRGLETSSTRLFLEWTDADGAERSVQITPEIHARIEGPYNRRNVYGAALAYGPVLPPALRDPVLRHALCGPAPLMAEIGLDASRRRGAVRVRLEPLPGADLRDLPVTFSPACR